MPKLKTSKGVKSRFKITANGKLVGFRAGRRHLLSGKRAKLKRQMKGRQTLAKVEMKRVKLMLPYN